MNNQKNKKKKKNQKTQIREIKERKRKIKKRKGKRKKEKDQEKKKVIFSYYSLLHSNFFRRSAAQNFAPAQFNLGLLYEKGLGKREEEKKKKQKKQTEKEKKKTKKGTKRRVPCSFDFRRIVLKYFQKNASF